jgi:hypothetical protein
MARRAMRWQFGLYMRQTSPRPTAGKRRSATTNGLLGKME